MSHASPNPNPHDDPSATPLLMGGIIGALSLVVSVLAVEALYFSVQQDYTVEKVYNKPSLQMQQIATSQRAELVAAPHWVDKPTGVVGIPISESMNEVIKEISTNPKAAASVSHPPPATQPAAAPPGAAPPNTTTSPPPSRG